jgi:hypothetical protein
MKDHLAGDLHSSGRYRNNSICKLPLFSGGPLIRHTTIASWLPSAKKHWWTLLQRQRWKNTTDMKRDHRGINHNMLDQLLVLCNAVSIANYNDECIQHMLNHQCSKLLHKAPVQLFVRQCTLHHLSDNGALKWKTGFERVFSWHTSSYTLAYHTFHMSLCVDAVNLFVVFAERLFQIEYKVWTGLS